MWAVARVLEHAYGPGTRCQGGDYCDHTVTIGVGLGFDGSNPTNDDDPYEAQVLQTVRNLFGHDKRMRDGHFFGIGINSGLAR